MPVKRCALCKIHYSSPSENYVSEGNSGVGIHVICRVICLFQRQRGSLRMTSRMSVGPDIPSMGFSDQTGFAHYFVSQREVRLGSGSKWNP